MTPLPLELQILLAIGAVITIVTFLSIIKFGRSEKPLFEFVKKEWESKLVYAFVLEIAAIFTAILWITVNKYERGASEISEAISRVSQLQLQTEEWNVLSHALMNEPSGIDQIELSNYKPERAPFGVVVDDEEPRVFLVQWVGQPANGHVLRTFDLVADQTSEAIRPGEQIFMEDFEAISVAGDQVYALTSHRELGKKAKGTRHLVRFHIDPNKVDDPAHKLEAISRDLSDKQRNIDQVLAAAGIDVDRARWKKKTTRDEVSEMPEKDDPSWRWQPYYLEFEGLAIRNNKLLLGLKYPLQPSTNNAILVVYDWSTDKFEAVHTLNLGGLGITGLDFDPGKGRLLVAASPPAKVRAGFPMEQLDKLSLHGSSKVFAFSWPTGSVNGPFDGKVGHSVARSGSKVEGIAIHGNELWLVHDGPTPAIVRTEVKRVFPDY